MKRQIGIGHTIIQTLSIATLLMFASFSSASWSTEQYAIFTLDAQFTELSRSGARKLYRGKTKRLDGNKFELSDWPKGSPTRDDFYQALLGKNIAQMNAYWASLSFSGKARPPKELKQDDIEALLEWMREKPNRIGYAPSNEIPTQATVLYRLEVDTE